jgi:hypothetical protein
MLFHFNVDAFDLIYSTAVSVLDNEPRCVRGTIESNFLRAIADDFRPSRRFRQQLNGQAFQIDRQPV